ncbi:hypothetical protein D3C72_1575310 [compost metagenome]
MPFAAQQRHNALFVHWRQARKQRGGFGKLCQFIVRKRFNIAARDNHTRIQPHFMTHFRRHQLAVAGKNFDGNAAGFQRFQRRSRRLFRWIEEGDVPFEDQIRLIKAMVIPFAPRQEFAGHRHDAQPLTVQVIRHTLDAAQHGVVQRHNFTVMTHLRGNIQDLLQRSFADQLMHIRLLTHHHRHAATLEVERDLIHFLPAR